MLQILSPRPDVHLPCLESGWPLHLHSIPRVHREVPSLHGRKALAIPTISPAKKPLSEALPTLLHAV